MSVGIDKLASELQKVIEEKDKNKKTPYDTEAEVVRVDTEVVWVKIPGGVDETPVQKTINAKVGDTVQVRVSGGRAFLVGNGTNPPTDDTRANEASYQAQNAEVHAVNAEGAASDAMKSAENARIDASIAHQMAENATESANEANKQAENATTYATNALGQLGVVEDVVGILDWASKHGTFVLTGDTEIVDGKVYFIYDSVSGDYTPVVEPKASELSTYYELTVNEAMNDFIMSHIAVTSRGLWVLPNGINSGSITPETGEAEADARARLGNKYKVLLSNDGMYIYDGNGQVVSTYGESITFSSSKPQYIGGQDAYIVFNPTTGGITIGGSKISFGSKSMSEALSDIDDAKKVATNYITNIDSAGIRIHAEDNTTDNYSVIDGNGLTVYKNGSPVAKFNDTVYVGNDEGSNSYFEIKKQKITGYNYRKTQYFQVGDISGMELSFTYTADGTSKLYGNNDIPSTAEVVSVTVNGEATTYWSRPSSYYPPYRGVEFSSDHIPESGAEIVITYMYRNLASYFTFNNRAEGSKIGEKSFSEGDRSEATAIGAHAEGYKTRASGQYSHAEGYQTIASGEYSHAEGKDTQASGYAHAEGSNTIARGWGSHASGYKTRANAIYSEAHGERTYAINKNNVVIGRYNYFSDDVVWGDDGEPTQYSLARNYPFVIGNGTSDTERSNAMFVTWGGIIHSTGIHNTIYCGDVGNKIGSYGVLGDKHYIELILKYICETYNQYETSKIWGYDNTRFIGYWNKLSPAQYALPTTLPSGSGFYYQHAYFDVMVVSDTKNKVTSDGLPVYAYGTFTRFPNVCLSFTCDNGTIKMSTVGTVNEIYVGDVTNAAKQYSDYTLTASSSDADWLKYVVAAICTGFPGQTGTIFKGTCSPNSAGYFEVYIYDTDKRSTSTWLPQYCNGTWRKWQNTFAVFSTNNYSFSYVAK